MIARRESKKADKKERIRSAAFRLFAERGYDETTMRDVAKAAKVALGTLSLYATDKRDLTLLVLNHHNTRLIQTAVQRVAALGESELVEQLVAFLGVFYEDWQNSVNLARTFIQLSFFKQGMHSADYRRNTEAITEHLEGIFRVARQRGEIQTPERLSFVAHHLFLTFSAAIKMWVAEDSPAAERGIADLRELIRLQINGLEPVRPTGQAAPLQRARQEYPHPSDNTSEKTTF